MIRKLATGADLGVDLVKALGLGELTTKVSVCVEGCGPVLVQVESYVTDDVRGELIKQLAEYRLVPRGDTSL
jgi:hypothetical protein